MLHSVADGAELRIPSRSTKNRKPRTLPLVGELAAIMERRRAARVMSCDRIFHRDGQPLKPKAGYRAIQRARRVANLPAGPTRQERFVFHSLRSYAATR